MNRLTEKSPTGANCIPLKNAAQGVDLPRWSIHETSILEDRLEGDAADRLSAYEDTGLEPDEIKDHEEMFKAYRHICGGLTPDEIPHWIPVSERLPEKVGTFIICTSYGDVFEADYWLSRKEFTRCNGSNFMNPVMYWQPLPQPPKGEKHGSEA